MKMYQTLIRLVITYESETKKQQETLGRHERKLNTFMTKLKKKDECREYEITKRYISY